ncbi:MAG: hypothetical protein ACYTFQ_17010 [Planctomycetota bacterium]|jgi:hypothetical protein
MDRQRGTEIKAFLMDLKLHLKKTKGDVRADAIAYLSPKTKKKAKKKRRSKRG